MSDPTAPDLPVLPPEPEELRLAPDPTPSSEPKPAAGWKGWVAAGAACGVVVVGGIYVTRDDDPAAVDTTSTRGPDRLVRRAGSGRVRRDQRHRRVDDHADVIDPRR